MAMFKNDEQIEQLQSPLAGYETCPLVSLEEAVKPLVSLVHDVEQMANDAKCRCEEPEEGLTTDESASIMLNTMQWRPSSECLHNKLNSALRSQSRSSTKSWFLYLKLLFTALWKLPSKRRFVYRIVHGDMSQDCREGDIITWWSFSSCTTSLTALQGFFKTNEDRTIFTVDCDSDRDIRHHSCLSNEDEILLLPDQQFKVEDCSQPARGLHMIRLREVQPGSVLLSLPLPSRSSASEGPAVQTTPKPMEVSNPTGTSAFHSASPENNIDLAKHLLQTMSLEDVDQMQPNGSTALHVATHRGHEEIVDLFLAKDACLPTTNKLNQTPLEEAGTGSVKTLLRRRRYQNRFCSELVEWIVVTNDADFQAQAYSKKLRTYGETPEFQHFIVHIKEKYLQKELSDIYRFNDVTRYFDLAIKESDPTFLLQAYTADTGFYSKLNRDLAQLQLENLTGDDHLGCAYYMGLIAFHPKFRTLSFEGTTYRGMMITENALAQYKKGTKILTKAFTSTSKQRSVAGCFSSDVGKAVSDKLGVICVYTIRNPRTALDMARVSEFPDEEEVLILPYSAFQIIDVSRNKEASPEVEITLRECERR